MTPPEALQELTKLTQWLIWRPRERNGKTTKPPFQGSNPDLFAKSNDPATWCDFDTAVRAVNKVGEGGVGFVFTGTHYAGMDLDKVRDPKTGKILYRWAQKLLDEAYEAGAYVELSPSESGFHIIGKAKGAQLDPRIDMAEGGSLEIYRKTSGRYFTMTGQQVGKCTRPMNIDDLIDDWKDRGKSSESKDKSSSGLFHKYVLELYQRKSLSVEEIVDEIRGRPRKWGSTKAEEYDRGNRLEQEVQRCIENWAKENDGKAERLARTKTIKWFYGSVPGDSPADCAIALTALGIHLRYDQFHDRVLMDYGGEHKFFGTLNDSHVVKFRDLCTEIFGVEFSKENMNDAVDRLAIRNEFHPVKEYLESLRWDGKHRIDRWVCTYMKVEDREIWRMVGRKTLIAACARIIDPGVKFDQIIVLESPEGWNKSTAIEILAGRDFFSDQTILGVNDREVQEVLKGVWLHEIADLKGMRHADTEHIKAFASRKTDRARAAYGRRVEWRDRQSILFATTNDRMYLKGETGNRRWWPLPLGGRIDIKALVRDRDQLWAEAMHYATEKESLELPRALWEEMEEEQEKRLPVDLMMEQLRTLQGTKWETFDDAGEPQTVERVSTLYIAKEFLKIQGEQLHNGILPKKIAAAMRRLQWNGPNKIRIEHSNTATQNGYERALKLPE